MAHHRRERDRNTEAGRRRERGPEHQDRLVRMDRGGDGSQEPAALGRRAPAGPAGLAARPERLSQGFALREQAGSESSSDTTLTLLEIAHRNPDSRRAVYRPAQLAREGCAAGRQHGERGGW